MRTRAHTRAPAPCAQPLNFAGATLALRGVGEIEGLFETTRLRFHDLPVRDKGDGPRLGLGLGLGLGLTLTITLTLTLTLILTLECPSQLHLGYSHLNYH